MRHPAKRRADRRHPKRDPKRAPVPGSAGDEPESAERVATAERGAWLGFTLARSVQPPIRVILGSLDGAGAQIDLLGRFLRGAPPPDGPDGQAGRTLDPDVALTRLRFSFEEVSAAASYLSRMVQDLCALAAAPASTGPARAPGTAGRPDGGVTR
jgi:hypothetical protein